MSRATEAKENGVFDRVSQSEEFRRLVSEIRRGTRIASLAGLTAGAAKALVLAALQRETGKTFAVVAETNNDLENWNGDLCAISDLGFGIWDLEKNESEIRNPKSEILALPSSDADPYAGVSPHAETLEQRALTLWKLAQKAPDFLLLTARALVAKTVTPEELRNLGAFLRREEDFPPEELIEKLVACGYVREEPVNGLGQFSSRGGIVDVWSPDCELPVRIEFWGDTVDSIREFDAETQLSTQQLKEISFAPMREFAANPADFRDWAFFARERFSDERFARALADRTQFADEGESFSGWEFLFPVLHERKGSVFDFLPENCVLVFDEPASVEKYLSTFYENLENRFAETNGADELGLAPNELFLTPEELRTAINEKQRLELRALGRAAAAIDEDFQAL